MTATFSRRRAAIVAVILAAVISAALLYGLADPMSVWFPKCPVKMLTGYDCPGCGSQRAIHALLHGDIAAAWRLNAFIFIMAPVLILVAVAEAAPRRCRRLRAAVCNPAAITVILIGTLIWAIGRNLL